MCRFIYIGNLGKVKIKVSSKVFDYYRMVYNNCCLKVVGFGKFFDEGLIKLFI